MMGADASTVVTDTGMFQYRDADGIACDPSDAVQVYIHDFRTGGTMLAAIMAQEDQDNARADAYNPSEPRKGKGPGGGEWTSGAAAGASHDRNQSAGAGRSAGRGREAVSGAAARSVQGNGGVGAPPLRKDGKLQLTHYSNQAKLSVIDPAFYGSGIAGAEAFRKAKEPKNWVDRTYYGLAVGEPGGYRKEPGLGPYTYGVSVDPSMLYDLIGDPDHLRPRPAGSSINLYEKRIKQAGYLGYWVNHHSLGYTAAVFQPLKPEGRADLEEMRQLVEATKKNGGVSYQPLTHDSPKPGDEAYMVSPYPNRSEILDVAKLTPQQLSDYVMKNQDVLTKPDHYLGTWHDTEGTGKVFLDVSIKAPTPQEATKICIAQKQIAYFSFKDMHSHDVQPDKRTEWVPDAAAATADSAHPRSWRSSRAPGEYRRDVRAADRAHPDAAGDRAASRPSQGAGYRGVADDFDPNEPRVPKGGKGAGEWTAGSGQGGQRNLPLHRTYRAYDQEHEASAMAHRRERDADIERANQEANRRNRHHPPTQLSNLPKRPGYQTVAGRGVSLGGESLPLIKDKDTPTQISMVKGFEKTSAPYVVPPQPNYRISSGKWVTDPTDHTLSPSEYQRQNSNQIRLKGQPGMGGVTGQSIGDLPSNPSLWKGRAKPGYHGAEHHSIIEPEPADPHALSEVVGNLQFPQQGTDIGSGHWGHTGERAINSPGFVSESEPDPSRLGPDASKGWEHTARTEPYFGTDEMSLDARQSYWEKQAKMWQREVGRLEMPHEQADPERKAFAGDKMRAAAFLADRLQEEIDERDKTLTPPPTPESSGASYDPDEDSEQSDRDSRIWDGDRISEDYGGPGVPNYDLSPMSAHAGNADWKKGEVKTVRVGKDGDWGHYTTDEIEVIKNPSPTQLANWVETQNDGKNTDIRWFADPGHGDIYCFDASLGWHIGPVQALGLSYHEAYLNSDNMTDAEHWPEQVEEYLDRWHNGGAWRRSELTTQEVDTLREKLAEPVEEYDPEAEARRRTELREMRGDSVRADDYNPDEPRKPAGEQGGGEWTGKGAISVPTDIEAADFDTHRTIEAGAENFKFDHDQAEINRKLDGVDHEFIQKNKSEKSADLMVDVDVDDRMVKHQVTLDLTTRLKDKPEFQSLKLAFETMNGQQAGAAGHPEPGSIGSLESYLLSEWAGTSGDSSYPSCAMQWAAQELFGMPEPKVSWTSMDSTKYGGMKDVLEKTKIYFGASKMTMDQFKKGLMQYIQAMYDNTQELLKKQGIKEIPLVRGMVLGGRGALAPTLVDLKMQPISAFSLSYPVARDFAGTQTHGILVFTKVPAKRVLSTYLSGYGCRSEHEVTVLGGAPTKAIVVGKFPLSHSKENDGYNGVIIRNKDRLKETVEL